MHGSRSITHRRHAADGISSDAFRLQDDLNPLDNLLFSPLVSMQEAMLRFKPSLRPMHE